MNPEDKPIEWHDRYFVSKDRIVLTEQQVCIPGVRVLAHHLMNNAISPLTNHYHKNAIELTLVIEGEYIFYTKETSYKTIGGNVFVAYPNEVHSTNESPLSHGEIYWIQLETNNPGQFLFLDQNAASELIQRLVHMRKHVIVIKENETLNYLKKAFQIARTFQNPYYVASYIVLFLNLLTEASEKQKTLSHEILKALDYIFDHLEEDIYIEEIAHISGLSISQFKLRFKNEIGISPRSFINTQKIESAKSMIAEGIPITQVAQLLSFNTSSYFTSVFRKYTMMTPSEYLHLCIKNKLL